MNSAVGIRILHERADNFITEIQRLMIADDDFDAKRFSSGFQNADILWMAIVRKRKRYFDRLL